MKPNELIGVLFFSTAITGLVGLLYTLDLRWGIAVIIGLFGQTVFLSLWGLETFNNLFKK